MVEGIQGNDAILNTIIWDGLLMFRLGLRLKLRKGDALLWLGCQWFHGVSMIQVFPVFPRFRDPTNTYFKWTY